MGRLTRDVGFLVSPYTPMMPYGSLSSLSRLRSGPPRKYVHEHFAGITTQSINDPHQLQHVYAALAALIVGDKRLRLAEQPRKLFLGQPSTLPGAGERSTNRSIVLLLNPHRSGSG
jgi:hypothetical protein